MIRSIRRELDGDRGLDRGINPETPAVWQAPARRRRHLVSHPQARQREADHRRRSTALRPTACKQRTAVGHSADVLIYATGFHASRFLWPMRDPWPGPARSSSSIGGTTRVPFSASSCPGLSQSLLPLRTQHQHRHHRKHHLLFGVRHALRHGLYQDAVRKRTPQPGMPQGGPRRLTTWSSTRAICKWHGAHRTFEAGTRTRRDA